MRPSEVSFEGILVSADFDVSLTVEWRSCLLGPSLILASVATFHTFFRFCAVL